MFLRVYILLGKKYIRKLYYRIINDYYFIREIIFILVFFIIKIENYNFIMCRIRI